MLVEIIFIKPPKLAKTWSIIAELPRAKRASGAPWVRIFGKSMRPRKFGAYTVRHPVRAYRLSGRGSGVLRQPDRGWGEENRLREMGSR